MNPRILSLIILLTSTFLLSGCGKSSRNDGRRDEESYVRVFNAVTDIDSVDITVGGSLYFSGVGYLEDTGYFKINTRDDSLEVSASNSFITLFERDGGFDDRADQSIFVYGRVANQRVLFTKDDNAAPGSNLTKLRIINLSSANRRGVDVYVAQSDSTGLPASPSAESLNTGAASRYLTSSSGQYEVVVTAVDATTPLATLSKQLFESREVYTLLIVDSPGGELPLRVILLQDSKS